MVTLAQERFRNVIDELKPLLAQHWRELALYQDVIEFDPDYAKYDTLDGMGVIKIYVARDEGAVVGYAVYVVMPHMHYKQDVWARCDIIWVSPEHRRQHTGVMLLRFVEERLRADGVSVMHTTGKVEHPALRALLEHEGHECVEFGHSKLLKGT